MLRRSADGGVKNLGATFGRGRNRGLHSPFRVVHERERRSEFQQSLVREFHPMLRVDKPQDVLILDHAGGENRRQGTDE